MIDNLAYASTQSNFTDDTLELVRRGEVLATETTHRGPETGERALMRAVLQDAILCLRGHATGVHSRDRQRAADQAYVWIASRDTTWPFSFESICHVLGLEPSSLRRRLLAELAASGEPATGMRAVWHTGGMVSRLRAVRMRGNQRKRTLRLRVRRRKPLVHAARRRPAATHVSADAMATS